MYNRLSDKDLLSLLRKGDREAFAEIYGRYHSLLYTYAHKKLQDRQESQDVVQEVLITLWDRRQKMSPDTYLSAYLYVMVRNRAFDLFARRKIEDRYLESLQGFIDKPEATDFRVRERDMQALIDREIEALPPRMREIFALSRKESLTNKEIAKLLNLSTHTVDTQIKRALKTLRLRLGIFVCLLLILFY